MLLYRDLRTRVSDANASSESDEGVGCDDGIEYPGDGVEVQDFECLVGCWDVAVDKIDDEVPVEECCAADGELVEFDTCGCACDFDGSG